MCNKPGGFGTASIPKIINLYLFLFLFYSNNLPEIVLLFNLTNYSTKLAFRPFLVSFNIARQISSCSRLPYSSYKNAFPHHPVLFFSLLKSLTRPKLQVKDFRRVHVVPEREPATASVLLILSRPVFVFHFDLRFVMLTSDHTLNFSTILAYGHFIKLSGIFQSLRDHFCFTCLSQKHSVNLV